MVADTLPVIPSVQQINADAARIADGMLRHLTSVERGPIAVYGRCLLAGVQPTYGETLRLIAALRRYVPYIYAAGRLSTDLAALRTLQEEIARCVAKGI